MPGFKGQILIFDANEKRKLRTAVMNTLKGFYPQTWHICEEDAENPTGTPQETGWSYKMTGNGFRNHTSLIDSEGKRHVLCKNLRGSSKSIIVSDGYKAYSQNCHTGLHVQCKIARLEDAQESKRELYDYMGALEWFFSNPTITRDSFGLNLEHFAAGIKDADSLNNLGSLKMLDIYKYIVEKLNRNTGGMDKALYYMDRALFADLGSLFFEMYPDSEFDLSPIDIRFILDSGRSNFINLLEKISSQKEASPNEAFALFKEYCDLLKFCIKAMQIVKSNISLLKEESLERNQFDVELLSRFNSVTQEKWNKIVTPSDITFNLEKNWPLTEELFAYAEEILALLPEDFDDLKQFYQSFIPLSNQNGLEPRERYRLNIIISIIQAALQEKIYHTALSIGKENSVFLKKLAKELGYLFHYGLKPKDFTQNLGDCLFDNVAQQINTDGKSVRDGLVEYLRTNRAEYSDLIDAHDCEVSQGIAFKYLEKGKGDEIVNFQTWEEYLLAIATPTVWATELELKALAFSINHPIVLLRREGRCPVIYNRECDREPIFIQHVKRAHFISCLPIEGVTKELNYSLVLNEFQPTILNDLLKKAINIKNRPSDINQILDEIKENQIAQIDHLQKWLKARDTLVVWQALEKKIKHSELNVFQLDDFSTSDTVIEKAKGFKDWFQTHKEKLDQIQTLALSHKDLSYIPKEIFQLTNLKNLFLNENQLSDLPNEIGDLIQLEILNLEGNQLTVFPEAIRCLLKLEELNLSENLIGQLPRWIGEFNLLTTLFLGYCGLSILPRSIGNLVQLKSLNLAGNALVSLPLEFENLFCLENIRLVKNKLMALPSGIGDFYNLRHLRVDDNELVTLPKEFGKLTNLEKLTIESNPISALPEEVEQLIKQRAGLLDFKR